MTTDASNRLRVQDAEGILIRLVTLNHGANQRRPERPHGSGTGVDQTLAFGFHEGINVSRRFKYSVHSAILGVGARPTYPVVKRLQRRGRTYRLQPLLILLRNLTLNFIPVGQPTYVQIGFPESQYAKEILPCVGLPPS